MDDQKNILIIDDNPNNLRLLSQLLVERGYKVRAVLSGERALAAVQSTLPDLILLDIMMPEMSGYELCRRLKAAPQTQDIPIIFISALAETEDKVKAFSVGGVDYVSKPFQVDEVLARVETHIDLRELRSQLQVANATLAQQLAELSELNEQLQKQNAELDAFAHTVAHDLKNPLNLVMGNAELLRSYAEPQDSLTLESSDSIFKAAKKMDNIIESLMLLSGVRRVADVTMHPLDMEYIVLEAQDRMADLIKERQVVITLPSVWPIVWGYGPWVEEVWANYLSNAIMYGGEPPHVEIGATQLEDGSVRFWVHDNGAGLTQEQQAQLFTPFERLEQARIQGGHGLGLSIVRRIVEKLGGTVGVESFPAEGCTFFFSLPYFPDEPL